MAQMIRPVRYAAGSSPSTELGAPTPTTMRYAEIADIVEELTGAAVYMMGDGRSGDASAIVAADAIDVYPLGDTNNGLVVVDCYVVTQDHADGPGADKTFMLERIGTITATVGNISVGSAVIGTDNWCKSVEFSSTGLLEARTGRAPETFGDGTAGSPCGVSMRRLGNATAVILVPARSTVGTASDAAHVIARVWRQE